MKAYKVEIYLNNKQKTFIHRCFGAYRYAYNWGLAEWKRQYETGEKPSAYGLCVQFNSIKDELCPWIRNVPYSITEAAFMNLGKAFDNFFRRIKSGNKPGYPKFKSRYNGKQSCHFRNTKIASDYVKITKLGWVKLKQSDYIPLDNEYGVYATVSKRANHYFISVLVKNKEETEALKLDGILGLDLGLETLVYGSDGIRYENPRYINDTEKKIAKINRELSRRQKGSRNREKTKTKLQRAYYKLSCQRENYIHNITSAIINKKPSTIVIEDLNVAGMLKNHHVSKSISDAGFGEIRRQLEYKAKAAGIEIVIADQWFASSKICSRCGHKKLKLSLSTREYHCENCGLYINRDENAARNLVAYIEGRNTPGLPVELGCSNVLL